MDLFSANFEIDEVDGKRTNGKQFDNVSRIFCHSENGDFDLVLDIASHIYGLSPRDRFAFLLSHQISNEPVSDAQHWHPSQLQASSAWKYEYVMYGRVYQYEEDSAHHKATVFVSFGGLLMSLRGEQNALKDIPSGRNLYLLMRKIKS
jgi:DNA-directed RNA polymerase I, II, and III subunit RPABC3